MPDEIWTTRDGQKIPVGEMSETHVRNALRLVLRQARKKREKLVQEGNWPRWALESDEGEREWPDNRAVLADLQQRHGADVRVEPAGAAGMSGGNVYVRDEWIGWFGGI